MNPLCDRSGEITVQILFQFDQSLRLESLQAGLQFRKCPQRTGQCPQITAMNPSHWQSGSQTFNIPDFRESRAKLTA